MAKEEVLHLMWVLVWMQLISGQPVEHFQLAVYENGADCEKNRKRAEIMVTHNGIAVTCLNVRTEK
jgi:hypothetical protein